MREGAGAGGGERQHLKPVRQRAGMAAVAAVFDIVMDRVVVGRDGLEGREMRLGHRSRRDVEALADRQILEIAALGEAMLMPVEFLAHDSSPMCRTPLRTSRSISGAP